MSLAKNQPCPECGRYDNRGISIDVVIIKDNKVLLIKRGVEPFKDHWALPGGYVEWDESAEETAIREAKEETSLTISNLKQIHTYSKPCRHPKQVVNIAFLADAEGEAKQGDDAIDLKWFKLTELPEDLAFDHAKIIKDAS